ncbi:hypothetical protein M431DRAFT_510189 [Trichoderma harzianum CBS 226.95]|uniref:Secreted protein n=1 Tax=Trichoderma harzianum CBS 226.95 TaxID=983964 RepID=A0A2T4A787_TRIHA|nr:hypothetical protein M431DRAFT_510189 [Trichoderma harzianum CBS 226.95]PTB52917.1 hypothetical protein M431DRAFT_510189 [Trichoderma harzianum CBS 226.95]
MSLSFFLFFLFSFFFPLTFSLSLSLSLSLCRLTASRKLNHKGREGKNEEVGGVVKTRGREAKRLSPGQAGDGFVFGG